MTQYRITADSAGGLVRAVEEAVAEGSLMPGERLPSVRRLAAQVGLSPATVAAGLSELRRRGVVLTEQRRGAFIGPRPPIGSSRPSLPVPVGARDLSRGNPDPALLPDLERALSRSRLPTRLYGEPPLQADLAAVAREQLRSDGLESENLCVVSGALDGIERVLQAHTRPGDRIAVENPGYAALYDLLRAQGLVLEAVAVDDRGMLPDQLRGALDCDARAAIVTPRGQNPTGAAFDAVRAEELRGVLADFPRVLVVEDDHLGAVAGSELHTIATGRASWAATRSVAKAFGPDLRLAVLTGDSSTVSRVQGRQQCGAGWVSHILQTLVHQLWSDPEVQELTGLACATYVSRREGLLRRLAARGVPAHGVSGLNVWVAVGDEAAVVGALLQRGWVVASGAPYRLDGCPPAIRITTATLEDSEADRLATDLAEVLQPARASRSG
jgi:DNA-binding transcriptional MocR family regulator